ncbi:MAG: hypothetical protein ACREX8_05145, partial [Gammaproteobacteria bacterium]
LEPTIDLRAVLGRSAVQEALARFATSKGDPAAREAAIDAIRGTRTGGDTDWDRGERRVDPLGPTESAEIEWLGGTVVICDCRGIQVGNHLRQYNTFSSVLAPTVNAHELFRDNPEFVETIVDYACGGDGITRRTVQDRLAEAVCGSADIALARPPGAGTRPYGSTVRNDAAIGVGDIRQTDVREFAARLPHAAGRAVERAKSRAEAARKAEAAAARKAEERVTKPDPGVPNDVVRRYFDGPQSPPPQPPRRSGPSIGGR